MNAVELTQALIRCPSVTPNEGGALVLIDNILKNAGFKTRRVDLNGISNLYARFGEESPVFAFNGHTDVVPIGNIEDWQFDPFGAEIHEGRLYGRGACDMKSGVAAYICAALEFIKTPFRGSLMLLITGDEEGDGIYGTQALLNDLHSHNETLDACIVGEPTCPNFMGEMIKLGRRGSLNIRLNVAGIQGHVAYPDRAKNPIPVMLNILQECAEWVLDEGYENFQPSNLEITSIDTGNSASNVIPARLKASMNIRYNPNHSAESLQADIHNILAKYKEDAEITVEFSASGDAFLTNNQELTKIISDSVQEVTHNNPILSTSGGTSDARFIKNFCPVVECGLVGKSMHNVDEYVEISHIEQLQEIYSLILTRYFSKKR